MLGRAETRKPSIEEVASHISALAWVGLRNLPRAPHPLSEDVSR